MGFLAEPSFPDFLFSSAPRLAIFTFLQVPSLVTISSSLERCKKGVAENGRRKNNAASEKMMAVWRGRVL